MPVYRTPKIEAAQNEAKAARPEDKVLLIDIWRSLVEEKKALQAQRQTLSEALGMHVPMHIVLMIID